MCKHPLVKTLLAALVLLLAAIPASAAFQPAACGDVDAWVAEHQHQLPHTLADFDTVPQGFEPGVFKALPADVRTELWSDFLDAYVAQRPAMSEDVQAFASYMADPYAFAEIDGEERETLSHLLASFTLHLVDPVSELAAGPSVGQVTLQPCNCNKGSDEGCQAVFCLPQSTGCGPSTNDPCNGCILD